MTRPDRPRCRLAAIALSAGCGLAAAGEPVRYAIDPVHTRVLFEIDHAGFSKAIGTVSGSEGSLLFDPEDWNSAKLDVVVPMQRLDMGDSGWSASVFAPRFLDVKRYPQARFVADKVTKDEGNRGTACGRLTLHGTTRPFCMTLVLNRIARYPLPPFRHTVGFSAGARLKRSDFGMRSWRSMVGDDVLLRIEAELVRRDAPDARDEPDNAPSEPASPEAPSTDNH